MSSSESLSTRIAGLLLDANAIQLRPEEPFTWSSGWKSPIYCDNRVTLSYPETRKVIRNGLAEAIREHFPNANALVGVATAGIAIGALASDALNIPYAYCRPKPKEHGMKNQLEGRLDKNSRVVVIEDLISTGGSSLKVVEYLRGEGIQVEGLAAIFTYGFDQSVKAFEKANCKFITLSSYQSLLEVAESREQINHDQLEVLQKWSADPEHWLD